MLSTESKDRTPPPPPRYKILNINVTKKNTHTQKVNRKKEIKKQERKKERKKNRNRERKKETKKKERNKERSKKDIERKIYTVLKECSLEERTAEFISKHRPK